MSDYRPTWANGIPSCALDECPAYDGKRCELMGFRPDGICEPAVTDMGRELAVARTVITVARELLHMDALRTPKAERRGKLIKALSVYDEVVST